MEGAGQKQSSGKSTQINQEIQDHDNHSRTSNILRCYLSPFTINCLKGEVSNGALNVSRLKPP